MKTYFLTGLNLKDRECFVVGNDDEATDKAVRLKKVGAKVQLWARHLDAEKSALIQSAQVEWVQKEFNVESLGHPFLVVFTDKADPVMTSAIRAVCDERRILFCAIDQPDYCDFVNLSLVERGHLKIGISTSGAAPAVGKRIRQGIEEGLKNLPVEEFFEHLFKLRKRLEKEVADPKERRKKLIEAAADFEFKAEAQIKKNESKN